MTINLDHVTEQIQVTDAATNASLTVQPKGTGSFNIAAGSSGVNISNGGTVTAITRTAYGSGYTSLPTPSVPAPTTAGGVQAVLSTSYLLAVVATVAAGGTGYTLNDVLTLSGGTFSTATTVTVSAVSGGVVTAVLISNNGNYSVSPSAVAATTGGTGTGCTINISYGINGVNITNAGSGYVEQPTVTFSGGGGSGAAAYATVGSGTTVQSLGSSLSFKMPAGGTGFQIYDAGGGSGSGGAYWKMGANFGSSNALLLSTGVGQLSSGGAQALEFYTNTVSQRQFNIAHTASAVNYVQVTGAATGNRPTISSQGSDTNISVGYDAKGTGSHIFRTSGVLQATISDTPSAVNYVNLTGAITGSGPIVRSSGTDTNIDLTLTPKGTGNVRFGTYTGTALSIAGYIEIKDSSGTIRKLAVVA